MSALISQGLQPGPFLIVEHREVIYGLFMSVLFATFALYIFGRLTLRWWMKILTKSGCTIILVNRSFLRGWHIFNKNQQF